MRALQRLGIADEGHAAVVRHVEPLVGVGGPGVGLRRRLRPTGEPGAGRRPEPEGAVDMHPRALGVRATVDPRSEGRRRRCSRCPLEGIRSRGPAWAASSARMRPWSSTGTPLRASVARPSIPRALISDGVGLLSDHHWTGGAPNRPPAWRRPSRRAQHGVPGRREARCSSPRRAGHEGSARCPGRQASSRADHRRDTSSSTAPMGDEGRQRRHSDPMRRQPVVATAAGRAPPITKPK